MTALVPHIGYDRAACTLKQAAIKLTYVTEEEYDKWVVPAAMTHPFDAETLANA